MNEVQYTESIRLAIKLIKDCDFVGDYNKSPAYPRNMANQLRNLTYEDEWKRVISNQWYNIQLEDNSILQFTGTSYRYLMVPYEALTLEEFIKENFSDPEYLEDDELYTGVTEGYQSFIESCTTNRSPTPVRFDADYCEDHFCSISHPVCHFHIGIDNNSRIPTKKHLSPFAFVAFILRTFYPQVWKLYIQSELHTENISKFKTNLNNIPSNKWDDLQENLFYLG